MITCETCGRTNQGQEVGQHWICGDCKVAETTEASKAQAQQIKDTRNVH
ncbi:hypothetical protein [Aneurinibacillus migulanus]|uniref:Uncharacterized protein n=1 Tax=Aneurinibacillus migulanus TaxID=47500 RepID=A0A1G8GRZ1_ANEMI|nr:hypothetical protein [Aneurinibacillus migulanus]MED0891122.1 hypothetical protein [Aneurinibacillus migulanus]MED1614190.1 hypothetical protein [Aneurinibacillus migulanus]MED4728172.1 hypothetical protein [Aneurinibacillus migulanus]SDH97129.1 hypothetical protein SAMN04487909_10185 [Aneurinibacillus migulanus]GED12903.1 hypothetical protein AMI01nite_08940 [Aneurinibacillus migulanus]